MSIQAVIVPENSEAVSRVSHSLSVTKVQSVLSYTTENWPRLIGVFCQRTVTSLPCRVVDYYILLTYTTCVYFTTDAVKIQLVASAVTPALLLLLADCRYASDDALL